MKLKIKSINAKIVLLYLSLAIINMSFFTMMVYENQIDLITENSKYHVKELTEDLVSSLKLLSADMGKSKIFPVRNRDEAIREISSLIKTKILSKDKNADFIIFDESGTTLYRSKPGYKVSKSDIKNGITAITNLDYTGRQFYSTIDERSNTISFFIPYKLAFLGDSIMLLKIEINELKRRLDDLYLLIIIILLFLALFHAGFAVILNRMLILPIRTLHRKSLEVSNGNLEARVDIERDDEIGELGAAFNSMTVSIREKILALEQQRRKMEYELDVAGGVQKLIFPDVMGNNRFQYAFFHRPYGKVSGDYYDILELQDSGIGYLIVDVSGHGVPAALVTMMIKEIFTREAPVNPDPSELFRRMNDELCTFLTRDEIFSGIYFTAIYMVIDKNNILHYCSAGHPPFIIVKRNLKKMHIIKSSAGPVGITLDMNKSYRTGKIQIESKDRIIMFTDGITESKNAENEQLGLDGLQAAIKKSLRKPAEESLQIIVDDLMDHIGSRSLDDDATIIMIEVI